MRHNKRQNQTAVRLIDQNRTYASALNIKTLEPQIYPIPHKIAHSTNNTFSVFLLYFLFSISVPPAEASFLYPLSLSLSLSLPDLAYNLHEYDLVPLAQCLYIG